VGRSWLPMRDGFVHGLAANVVGWSVHGITHAAIIHLFKYN
jgi:hypothetical protein